MCGSGAPVGSRARVSAPWAAWLVDRGTSGGSRDHAGRSRGLAEGTGLRRGHAPDATAAPPADPWRARGATREFPPRVKSSLTSKGSDDRNHAERQLGCCTKARAHPLTRPGTGTRPPSGRPAHRSMRPHRSPVRRRVRTGRTDRHRDRSRRGSGGSANRSTCTRCCDPAPSCTRSPRRRESHGQRDPSHPISHVPTRGPARGWSHPNRHPWRRPLRARPRRGWRLNSRERQAAVDPQHDAGRIR